MFGVSDNKVSWNPRWCSFSGTPPDLPAAFVHKQSCVVLMDHLYVFLLLKDL